MTAMQPQADEPNESDRAVPTALQVLLMPKSWQQATTSMAQNLTPQYHLLQSLNVGYQVVAVARHLLKPAETNQRRCARSRQTSWSCG